MSANVHKNLMGALILSTAMGVVATGCVPTASAVNPTLAAILENTWVKIDSGGLATDPGILYYSGMAYDDEHGKLLVFGGGHYGYSGNEVWAFDPETLQWTRMYEPDPVEAYSATYASTTYPGALFYPDPNAPLSEARPMTRHNYDTVEFISSKGIMFTAGQYTWGEPPIPYCWGCGDTWTYDLDTNKWTYRNLSGASVPDNEGGSAAYDSRSDLVYHINKGQTWAYDVNSDSWMRVSTIGAPTKSIESNAEYDSKRHAILLFGGNYPAHNELWKYDIEANTWTKLSPAGTPPPPGNAYGFTYDSANDVFVAYGTNGIGTYVYHPVSNTWTKQNPPSGEPAEDNGVTGIYSHLRYDPRNNVIFLVAFNSGYTIETWAYRYGAAVLDTSAPTVPTELSAMSLSDSEVQLTWAAAEDPESGISTYRVYRDNIQVWGGKDTSYTDTSLEETTSYNYQVSAVNGMGLEGQKSALATATTTSDMTPPTINAVTAFGNSTTVEVIFSEPVEQGSAETAANYVIDGGISVLSAALDGDAQTVSLTTTALSLDTTYTLTVNNVLDRAASPNLIAPDSKESFTTDGSDSGSDAGSTGVSGSVVGVDGGGGSFSPLEWMLLGIFALMRRRLVQCSRR
jgi:hypothetical protein